MKKIFTLFTALTMSVGFAVAETVTISWPLVDVTGENAVASPVISGAGADFMTAKDVALGASFEAFSKAVVLKADATKNIVAMCQFRNVDKTTNQFPLTPATDGKFLVSFSLSPVDGYMFIPTTIKATLTQNASDKVRINAAYVADGVSNTLKESINPGRCGDKENYTQTHETFSISEILPELVSSTGEATLAFNVWGASSSLQKRVGFANIIVEGEVVASGIVDTRIPAPISWNETNVSTTGDKVDEISITLSNEENLAVSYASNNTAVVTVDETTGNVTLTGTPGIAEISATYDGDADKYKPTTVRCNIIVGTPKEIKIGDVLMTIGAIGNNEGTADKPKYVVAANTEIFADANVTMTTTDRTTVRSADAKNICGNDFANYIQIRDANADNTELVIVPTVNMEIVVYGRLQDKSIDQPIIQNTKNITLKESGVALTGKIYFSEWQTNYEYFLMGQAFQLEAGKTYTLSASGFGFRLYGIGYTPVVAAEVEAPAHDQAEGVVKFDGTKEVVFTPAADSHVVYTSFVAAVTNDAQALAADPTIEHEGKTFTLAADNKVTVDKSGVLHYFAMDPATGVKSPVNTIEFSQTTGINDIDVDNASAPVEYFNLQGIRVENPTNGLYIRRQGNKVTKVVL